MKQGPSNFNTNLEQEHAEILHFETNSKFTYWPVCRAWQEEKCQLFGLLFVRGNQAHVTKSSVCSLDHPPQVVVRWNKFLHQLTAIKYLLRQGIALRGHARRERRKFVPIAISLDKK